MAIPTKQDHALNEIAEIADGIKVRLTVMRFAGKKGSRDFASLRNELQHFVNKVMEFARSTQA